jgi:hypothetical protein
VKDDLIALALGALIAVALLGLAHSVGWTL